MTIVRPVSRAVSMLAVAGLLGGAGCDNSTPAVELNCSATNLVAGSPGTIDDAVRTANTMLSTGIAPVTLPCFLERLDRPLSSVAVVSLFSLQPSVGKRSPRIFLFSGKLVMSVVPAGAGRDFLELAEYTTPTRSIKAEIAFPVQVPVAASEPYDRVREDTTTVCGGCHRSEHAAPQVSVSQGFESDVLRPRKVDEVPLPYLLEETRLCDAAVEPERCRMLDAVYSNGEVRPGEFSSDAPTIFY